MIIIIRQDDVIVMIVSDNNNPERAIAGGAPGYNEIIVFRRSPRSMTAAVAVMVVEPLSRARQRRRRLSMRCCRAVRPVGCAATKGSGVGGRRDAPQAVRRCDVVLSPPPLCPQRVRVYRLADRTWRYVGRRPRRARLPLLVVTQRSRTRKHPANSAAAADNDVYARTHRTAYITTKPSSETVRVALSLRHCCQCTAAAAAAATSHPPRTIVFFFFFFSSLSLTLSRLSLLLFCTARAHCPQLSAAVTNLFTAAAAAVLCATLRFVRLVMAVL